jgi:hypothetical protein
MQFVAYGYSSEVTLSRTQGVNRKRIFVQGTEERWNARRFFKELLGNESVGSAGDDAARMALRPPLRKIPEQAGRTHLTMRAEHSPPRSDET